MFLTQNSSERSKKAKELLDEINKVEDKFFKFGDILAQTSAELDHTLFTLGKVFSHETRRWIMML